MKNFDNLKPDTNYTVTVTDANGCNVVINFTTNSPTPLPPNAPIISLSEKTSDTISLSWTIPDSDSGIRGYILNVNGADRPETSSNTLTLENLDPSTNYVIKVKAIGNNNLESEWSDVLEVTTNDDLGPPFQMTFRVGDNDSITLPTISTGNYDFTVDWGDGTSDTITSWSDLKRTHNYITAGDYQVSITGLYDRQNFSTNASRNKLISVDNFGDVGWATFENAFNGCRYLVNIAPIYKFDYQDFSRCFYSNTQLASIPEGLFDNCPNITNLTETFASCKLASIPEGLFDNCPNITNLTKTFYGNQLVSIPEGLFDNCPNITNLTETFFSNKLVSIPEGLFDNCPNVTSFNYTFYYNKLTSIPEGLFDNCPNATHFSMTFSDNEIISIPSSLFINNTKAIEITRTFADNQITSIPEGLFDNCPNVTSFSIAFADNQITSIPEGLFDNCPNVTNFSNVFSNNQITSIPEGLFDNCPNVTNFNFAFRGNNTLTGLTPKLWLRTNPTPTGDGCFRDCTGLDDYDLIPSNWK